MSLEIKLIVGAILLAILLAAVGYTVHSIESKAVAKEKAVMEAEYTQQLNAQRALVQKAQDDLAASKKAADKDKQDAIADLNTKHAALVDSLRKRASRAEAASKTGSSTTAGVAGSCTGAELYREDAEFLAGEAARADAVIIERDYYYGRYEAARKLLAGSQSDAGQQGSVSDSKPVSGN